MPHLPKCLLHLRQYAPDVFARIQDKPELLANVPAEALDDERHPFWSTPAAAAALDPLFMTEEAPESRETFADTATNFDRWRNQYREPAIIAAPSVAVLDCLFSWHGGQGSRIYAAASHWNAGHKVTRDVAQAALDELDSMSGRDNFTADDAAALEELRAHLEES